MMMTALVMSRAGFWPIFIYPGPACGKGQCGRCHLQVGAAMSVYQAQSSGGAGHVHPLLLSSVKSHMGHAEPAAGVLGLARLAAQALQAVVSPTLHLRTLNPYLHSALLQSGRSELSVQLNRQLLPWSLPGSHATGGRRLGGVSSFAFMGTNAHVMVAGPGHAGHNTPAGEAHFRTYRFCAACLWACVTQMHALLVCCHSPQACCQFQCVTCSLLGCM
jgi:acyl transferase domain-containing protein